MAEVIRVRKATFSAIMIPLFERYRKRYDRKRETKEIIREINGWIQDDTFAFFVYKDPHPEAYVICYKCTCRAHNPIVFIGEMYAPRKKQRETLMKTIDEFASEHKCVAIEAEVSRAKAFIQKYDFTFRGQRVERLIDGNVTS